MRTAFSILIIIFFSISAYSQKDITYQQGKKYIDIKLTKLESYNKRLSAKQDRLLGKLKKQEKRLFTRLKKKDSVNYALLSAQPVSFDSISRLQRPDSATLAKKNRSGNGTIDSLKKINSFIITQSDNVGFTSPIPTNSDINSLQQELNYSRYKDQLITQQANNMKSASTKSKLPGFTSIEKKVFYARQQMKALKEISDEPSKAEEKALEYLQGTDGFDKYLDNMGSGSSSMKGLSPEAASTDIEKMGFQTKKQLEASLKQKFGNNLQGVTQKMRGQVKEFQDQIVDVKKNVQDAKKTATETKGTINSARNIEKPSFKVNPMRGKLFWQRIEKQYNWQITRATTDKPAMLEASAIAGFKHTPKLTYGVGVATSIGLGQGWNKIRFSFEGIGLRSFANLEWQYGIGAYAGYERMYKKAAFNAIASSTAEQISRSIHSTNKFTESMLIGLTKSYHINTKYNGAVQVLYDVWWKEKGLRSPVVLRFSTKTK